tara:strand:+ start:6071 stop:7081 length:1011 start_codon:yes stop_codon:yes gene_type:complete
MKMLILMTLASKSILLFFLILYFSCQGNYKTFLISGYTQGTTYNIKYHSINQKIPKESIDSLLKIIDMSMSTYIPFSTISKLNRNEDVILDSLITYVILKSIDICNETNGMFDITVSPLVNYWGFGPKKNRSFKNNNQFFHEIGCDKISIQNKTLIKSDSVKIDLNGIAQGFSVDFLSKYFKSKFINDFMIEIGGEITCSGDNLGKGWKIGIESPTDKNRDLVYILNLQNVSLATSGNYRNYYYSDSMKISHNMNPKTLKPSSNSLLSATIISDNCTSADAYATACMALGFEGSKELMSTKNIIGSLAYKSSDDTVYYFSNKFSSFLHMSPGSAPQ